MSDMKAYLAQRYMSGPKADAILARSGDGSGTKKRKKKPKNEDYTSKLEDGEGLKMRDEDEWNRGNGDDEMNDEDAPVVGAELATFKKSKSTWSSVGSTSLPLAAQPPTAGPSNSTPDAEAETEAKPDVSADKQPKKPATKRKGGLRTAAQMREEAEALKQQQAAEAAAAAAARAEDQGGEASTSSAVAAASGSGPAGPGQTVHRDASGRIVDVDKLKREGKEKEEEEKRKAREREEWSKGLVQRQRQQDRAREEAEMGRSEVARYANDARMNREMREVERWNDPAAEFLTTRKKKKGPRRPKYEKAYPQNRFNIPPGFRWDGVDRSNGFEKKYFNHQNMVARRNYAADQMGMEDM